MFQKLLFLVLVLALAGCKVTQEAIETLSAQASGNDRFSALAEEALSGKADGRNGVAAISTSDLDQTPHSVRLLLQRLLDSVAANQFASRSVLFQLNEGPDPVTLEIVPVKIQDPYNPDRKSHD